MARKGREQIIHSLFNPYSSGLAGTPKAFDFAGRSRITTEPAPTIAQSPILTPGITELPIPRNVPSPTITPPPRCTPGRNVREIINSAIVVHRSGSINDHVITKYGVRVNHRSGTNHDSLSHLHRLCDSSFWMNRIAQES